MCSPLQSPFQPQKVSDVLLVFPAGVMHLMPALEEIPEDFQRGRTKLNALFGKWFYGGLKSLQLAPKDGIDTDIAIRHIRCIMGSFEPKHEHKEAAVAFLLDQWFEGGEWAK